MPEVRKFAILAPSARALKLPEMASLPSLVMILKSCPAEGTKPPPEAKESVAEVLMLRVPVNAMLVKLVAPERVEVKPPVAAKVVLLARASVV